MAFAAKPRERWHEITKSRFQESQNKSIHINPHASNTSSDGEGVDGVPMGDESNFRHSLLTGFNDANSIHTRLSSSNKGFRMLSGLGWREGQPLGLSPDGQSPERVDPIPFNFKQDFLGLGKTEQESEVIIATVSQRREMDSERQTRESEGQRKTRQEQVALLAGRHQEITTTLKPFYCELCDKQFKTVTQYDEHTNSYAHHHKARAKDKQASLKPKADGAGSLARKEKERLREERVLRKMAKAAGVKINVASSASLLPKTNVNTVAEFGEKTETGTLGWSRVGMGTDALSSLTPAHTCGPLLQANEVDHPTLPERQPPSPPPDEFVPPPPPPPPSL